MTAATGGSREFFRPESALWWLYCAAVAVGGAGLILEAGPVLAETATALWSVAPLIVLMFVLFTAVILGCDPYRARRAWPLVAATVFGGTAATWLALRGNAHLLGAVTRALGTTDGSRWQTALAGPVTEEWIKTLGVLLVMLIASCTLTRPMHGLLVGAFVGLGFQIVENVVHAANGAVEAADSDLAGALETTVVRALYGVSSHWLFSAVAGVGVAILLGRVVGGRWTRTRRVVAFVALYLVAWSGHFLWNAPLPSLLVPVEVLLYLVLFALVARWAWAQERAWLAGVAAEAGWPDDRAVAAAIGPLGERRRTAKAVRRDGGRPARRCLARERRGYLDRLQRAGDDEAAVVG